MLRHMVRILRSDWAGWAPSMGVVAAVTVLVTACTNQFLWTSSTEFLDAARRSGLDGGETGAQGVGEVGAAPFVHAGQEAPLVGE